MKNKISITVIIPCFNSSKTLIRAIESVVKQSKLPKEVILIDDCSVDDFKTLKEIEKCKKILECSYINVVVIKNKFNLGPGESRNKGCSISQGKYIAFLDSDDSWLEEKLETQHDFMEKNQEFFLSCHDSYYIKNKFNIKNHVLIKEKYISGFKITLLKMFFKNFVQTRTVMFRNNKLIKFNNNLRYAEDYDLWLRLLINNNNLFYINKKLANCFIMPGFSQGLSSDLLLFWINEIFVLFRNGIKVKKALVILPLILIFSFIKFIIRIIKFKLVF